MVNKLRGLYESEKSHKSYPQAFKDEAVLMVLEQGYQRRAYKVTTQRKHSDAVADNLLNMNFNPVSTNKILTVV
ncbi:MULTISPECIES: hypothetical protein [Shewanella]|jgi:hypothetical protein|uniref:hypothetical protein n=1 Tax=Shewanella TaxID=22 RepID=UPI0000F0BAEC|nr:MULTISPECIES: hypothetical protein [Shewanella]MCA1898287.1 hypothetical protein [Shewanella putrefaciens]MCK7630887.1 hypothetical protein [Shewanella sp. JNE9-1]MCK7635285.1 hypothetical protein [Shewanella sp. JNE17]MCK7646153.1 hypothetical protein [Shewanella sp. JNE3-1]MCK7650511.1 hypothetical protein [Shewanella sp. JNE8]